MSRRKVISDSPVWDCSACIEQFMSGVRCAVHNPTPEEREARPSSYVRDRLTAHLRDNSS
jgi:hypothetical protein